MNVFSPIHHMFAPHVDARFAFQTLRILCTPWQWRNGGAVEKLRNAIAERLGGNVFLFSSGREALLALLRAMKLTGDAEVIVQGYTCVAVPNAIHAAGGKAVYADIERESLNIDMEALEASITSRTRAVICQHTFGIPAETCALRALCDERKILLIEDCAHVIPDASGPKDVARLGDAVILSFGRDKALSGIAGGAVIVRHAAVAEDIRREEDRAEAMPMVSIARLLFYPLAYATMRPLYGCGLGKLFLYGTRKIGILPAILEEEEKEGRVSPVLHRMPHACAMLALASWKRLRCINDHRRNLTTFYNEEGAKRGWPMLSGATPDLPLQKFPLFVFGAKEIRAALKRMNIHLDDGWTGCVICPESVNMEGMHYEAGSDPTAEAIAESILSLPTHPTMTLTQAKELAQALDPLLHPSP